MSEIENKKIKALLKAAAAEFNLAEIIILAVQGAQEPNRGPETGTVYGTEPAELAIPNRRNRNRGSVP